MTATGGESIILPWPPRELSPNARVHFRTKAAATKAYREQAYWLAYNCDFAIPATGNIGLRFDFHPPDKRRRDLDNMLASAKAAIDGIADALAVDDQRFGYWLSREAPIKGGAIIVSVMP